MKNTGSTLLIYTYHHPIFLLGLHSFEKGKCQTFAFPDYTRAAFVGAERGQHLVSSAGYKNKESNSLFIAELSAA